MPLSIHLNISPSLRRKYLLLNYAIAKNKKILILRPIIGEKKEKLTSKKITTNKTKVLSIYPECDYDMVTANFIENFKDFCYTKTSKTKQIQTR